MIAAPSSRIPSAIIREPVPVGSRLRAGVELTEVVDVNGGIDTTMVITVEREGSDKPVCVVESLSRYLA